MKRVKGDQQSGPVLVQFRLCYRLFGHSNVLTEGWSISGTSRFSSGFPVTLYNNSDTSLLGTFGNGVNNNLLDTPNFTPGDLEINHDPAKGPAFNTALFSIASLTMAVFMSSTS